MSAENPTQIHATGEATGFIAAPGDKGKPITVIGTNSIRASFDATCLQQALNARGAPGVTDLVLNPDAHAGYGAPVVAPVVQKLGDCRRALVSFRIQDRTDLRAKTPQRGVHLLHFYCTNS
jgi:hypothetical protein